MVTAFFMQVKAGLWSYVWKGQVAKGDQEGHAAATYKRPPAAHPTKSYPGPQPDTHQGQAPQMQTGPTGLTDAKTNRQPRIVKHVKKTGP